MLQEPIYKFDLVNNICDFYWRWITENPGAIPLIEKYQKMKAKKNDANWRSLSSNPNATHIMQQNPSEIDWYEFSANKNATHILKKNIDKIDWRKICDNPDPEVIKIIDENLEENFGKLNWGALARRPEAFTLIYNTMGEYYKYAIDCALTHPRDHPIDVFDSIIRSYWGNISLNPSPDAMEYLENNPDKINWGLLAYNSSDDAIDLLKKNMGKFSLASLSPNTHPEAVKMLEENLDQVNWSFWSYNPSAFHILEKNIDKINWRTLNLYGNEKHMKLLEKYLHDPEKVDWISLCSNPHGIGIIKNNMDKIGPGIGMGWKYLSKNENIMQLFQLDYDAMKERNKLFVEELTSVIANPARLLRICEQYNMDFNDLLENVYGY